MIIYRIVKPSVICWRRKDLRWSCKSLVIWIWPCSLQICSSWRVSPGMANLFESFHSDAHRREQLGHEEGNRRVNDNVTVTVTVTRTYSGNIQSIALILCFNSLLNCIALSFMFQWSQRVAVLQVQTLHVICLFL